MTEYIYESGMNFIADHTFHIEESKLYAGTRCGIRSVEFLRMKGNRLLFVEAKTTFPNPYSADGESEERCREAIQEVCDKFKHALNLYASAVVGVREKNFPEGFELSGKIALGFILVIRNHKSEWCRDIEVMIGKSLPLYLMTIWRPNIRVINHDEAIKYGLAS